jgi:DNA methylase
MPELQFKGKEFVYNHHLTVPYRPLEMDAGKSIGKPNLNGNLIIHGDNLHALKALLPLYAGKVDCIFVDPPYNTGNENWSYNDNVNSPMMREWLSSNPVTIEDGLRHDKWCAMMYPRLKLLHELLSDQGSFWMTIDDNEVHHARGVLDEVFGQERFIACVVWQKRTSPESRLRLGTAQDYILVYGNGQARTALRKLSINEEQESGFANPDNDPRGPWTSTDFSAQGYRPNQMYKITTPSGAKYDPPAGAERGICAAAVCALPSGEGLMGYGEVVRGRAGHAGGKGMREKSCRPYGTCSIVPLLPGTSVPGFPIPPLRGWERGDCISALPPEVSSHACSKAREFFRSGGTGEVVVERLWVGGRIRPRGLKPTLVMRLYAALKRRSSTSLKRRSSTSLKRRRSMSAAAIVSVSAASEAVPFPRYESPPDEGVRGSKDQGSRARIGRGDKWN